MDQGPRKPHPLLRSSTLGGHLEDEVHPTPSCAFGPPGRAEFQRRWRENSEGGHAVHQSGCLVQKAASKD